MHARSALAGIPPEAIDLSLPLTPPGSDTMPRATTNSAIKFLLAIGAMLLAPVPGSAQQAAAISEDDLATIHPRVIGPAVTGGRITDVDVDPTDPSIVYVATAAGGLWKSTNRTQQWTNVFADQLRSGEACPLESQRALRRHGGAKQPEQYLLGKRCVPL